MSRRAAPTTRRALARPAALRRALLAWFDAERRELPWRSTRDPWAILVSEIMLQQTTVSAARPYYERFLARWPTAAELAAARTDDILAEWSGLGYYSRARNLHATAGLVAEAGELPSDSAGLRR
ncbi:MAG TPA: A/G-specific adenine glycosylase, partial [Planctomycetota bacterium]|nr:A/G-specific adenine glycosylase [Planctomycetota bacterium]